MSKEQKDSRVIFAENLKLLIAKSGKSRQTISEDIGVAYSTFSEWCSGKKYPRIDKIELLSQYFKVPVAQLVGGQAVSTPIEMTTFKNSRSTFVENLHFYMAKSGKSRKVVAEAIGVSYFTFSDWCNGKKYPRVEKIDALAKYFGIPTSDLVGAKTVFQESSNIDNEMLSVISRLFTDAPFLALVMKINTFDSHKITALESLIGAFDK